MKHEIKIREQRTIEATRKNLMGPGGKFGCIVRFLGEPIIAQSEGGDFMDVNYLDDYGEAADPFAELTPGNAQEISDQIPIWESELAPQLDFEGAEWSARREASYQTSEHKGWLFDGMSRGIHLEIKYLEEKNELSVYYKGHQVYLEIAGELEGYYPLDEWEAKIDSLYKVARTKEREVKKLEMSDKKEAGLKKKKAWMQKMKNRWNIDLE